jgi:hypothetical protein
MAGTAPNEGYTPRGNMSPEGMPPYLTLWFQICPIFANKALYGEPNMQLFSPVDRLAAILCGTHTHVEIQYDNVLYGTLKHDVVHAYETNSVIEGRFRSVPWERIRLHTEQFDVARLKKRLVSMKDMPYDTVRATLSPFTQWLPDAWLPKNNSSSNMTFCSQLVLAVLQECILTDTDIRKYNSFNTDPHRLREIVIKHKLGEKPVMVPAIHTECKGH